MCVSHLVQCFIIFVEGLTFPASWCFLNPASSLAVDLRPQPPPQEQQPDQEGTGCICQDAAFMLQCLRVFSSHFTCLAPIPPHLTLCSVALLFLLLDLLYLIYNYVGELTPTDHFPLPPLGLLLLTEFYQFLQCQYYILSVLLLYIGFILSGFL